MLPPRLGIIIISLLTLWTRQSNGTARYGFHASDTSSEEEIFDGLGHNYVSNRYLNIFTDEKSLKQDSKSRIDWKSKSIKEDPDWPGTDVLKSLGQISGIAAHANDTLFIFHRGDYVWDYRPSDATYPALKSSNNGPIMNDTVVMINTKTGKLIKSWGSRRFYIPHGITVDKDGNVWLTDVARHQVFRFKRDSYDTPDLVFGQAFTPGNDLAHFCRPTDVAVSSTGIIYISDGYCNSRILMVSPLGYVIEEIGINENMVIPHSLVLFEEENLICVADRENERVLCYTAGLNNVQPGVLVFNVHHPSLSRVFAIDRIGDVIFALSVPREEDSDSDASTVVALDLARESLVSLWKPESGLRRPHDLTISLDGKSMFVSDLSPKAGKTIIKFKL